jgi:hypothetical protein
MFWLIVVAVVAFCWGFAAGATHEQYKPVRKAKPHIKAENAKATCEWSRKLKAYQRYYSQ